MAPCNCPFICLSEEGVHLNGSMQQRRRCSQDYFLIKFRCYSVGNYCWYQFKRKDLCEILLSKIINSQLEELG